MLTRRLDHNHTFAFHGNVMILVWGRETLVDAVVAVCREMDQFGAQNPQGGGLVTIVEADAEMPSTAARSAVADLLRRATYVRRSALIQEGSGFRAAAVRGVVTGMTLLAKQSFPHQVFDSTRSAIPWMIAGLPPHLGAVMSPLDLESGIQDARRVFDEHRRGRR